MKVDVDRLAMKIHFHMPESDDFDDVETLEDYSVVSNTCQVINGFNDELYVIFLN